MMIGPRTHGPARSVAVAVGLLALNALPALAQVSRSARIQSAELGSELRHTSRVGLFNAQASLGGAPGLLGGSAGSAPTTNNRPAASFGGRRPSGQGIGTGFVPLAAGTARIGMNQRIMMRPIGYSASAFYYARPVYSGYGPIYFPSVPGFTDPMTYNAVYRAPITANRKAYHYPLYESYLTGNMRDALTQDSLANAELPTEDVDPDTTTSTWLTDRLDRNMLARREAYLEQAYDYLATGDNIRARSAFESAELAGSELIPLQGKLLCALAEEQYSTARYYLARLLVRDDEGVFSDLPAPLRELFPEGNQLIDGTITYLAAEVRRGNEVDANLGLQAYVLWLDGQRSKAIAAADRVVQEKRSSGYAVIANRMRDQIEVEETGTAPAAPALPRPEHSP